MEETEIVVQYVIKFEKTNVEHDHPHEHHGHYSGASTDPDESKHAHIHKHLHLSFKSELYMDHESAYFYLEKNHN